MWMRDDHERRERLTTRLEALEALSVLLSHALASGESLEHWHYGIEQLMLGQIELLGRDLKAA